MTLSTLAVSILLVLIRSWNISEGISSSNALCYGHIDSRLFNNIKSSPNAEFKLCVSGLPEGELEQTRDVQSEQLDAVR